MRARPRLPAVSALALLLVGCGGPASETAARPSLTLFVAASLTDVIQQVGDAYARAHSVALTYNFAASGALAQQLLASPRADVFLSASERWMDAVERGGRIVAGSRRTLLSNSLVVITNGNSRAPAGGPEILCAPDFAYLTIGDPESVPAGRYAQDWLRSYACPDGSSAWDAVAARVSPTPDVRAALAQVEGSADVIGVVYRTDWMARRDRVRLLYEVPAHEGPTIRYPVALVAGTSSPEAARDFLAFLGGPTARALFEKAGFTLLPQP